MRFGTSFDSLHLPLQRRLVTLSLLFCYVVDLFLSRAKACL